MRVHIHEIKDQPTELHFDESETWVRETVTANDESAESPESLRPRKTQPLARPISVSLNLRKVDEVVVLKGHLDTSVQLVCSRCAKPFSQALTPSFSSLFCKDPVLAGVGYLGEDQNKPEGVNHGYARHHRDGTGKRDIGDSETTEADLDITYLADDYIELGDVLSEQIQLQIPFQPLCSETCQGVCATCGTDLNVGKCACSRIRRDNPFSVLKDIKLS